MDSVYHLSNHNLNVFHDTHPLTSHRDDERIVALSDLSRGRAHQIGNLQNLARAFYGRTSCLFESRRKSGPLKIRKGHGKVMGITCHFRVKVTHRTHRFMQLNIYHSQIEKTGLMWHMLVSLDLGKESKQGMTNQLLLTIYII